jgi:hypothetical protein
MLEAVDLLAFYPVICIGVGLCSFYLAFFGPWWARMDAPSCSNLQLHYQKGSKYIEEVIRHCNTLQVG